MAKAKLATVPAAPQGAAEAPPRKKGSKLVVLGLAAVLLAGAGGAGAWYFLGRHAPEGEAKHEERPGRKSPPTFVTLEPFTVNLMQEDGERYLQLGVVYQVNDGKTVDAMKLYMPIIRNRILLSLSSKKPSELASVEGKQKLVAELVTAARQSLPGESAERGVDGALLSSFVVQ